MGASPANTGTKLLVAEHRLRQALPSSLPKGGGGYRYGIDCVTITGEYSYTFFVNYSVVNRVTAESSRAEYEWIYRSKYKRTEVDERSRK